ncbi:MAG: signal peptidase I [Gemmatimonadetes bacterium]|nr:signal peptidase I [Gemmatimonadota bacterium]
MGPLALRETSPVLSRSEQVLYLPTQQMAEQQRKGRKEVGQFPPEVKRTKSNSEKTARTSRRRRFWLLVDGVLVAIVLAIVLALSTGMRIRIVRGASMGPALPEGTLLLVGMSPDQIARGDVLLFRWNAEEDVQIKRAVALGGDTVAMSRGILTVNGRFHPEPYASMHGRTPVPVLRDQHLPILVRDTADYRPTEETWGPLVVPHGYLWMLGDNRPSSIDSRHRGPTAVTSVEALALRSVTMRRLGH